MILLQINQDIFTEPLDITLFYQVAFHLFKFVLIHGVLITVTGVIYRI